MTSEKILRDLLESVIAAKAHYQVWWVLISEARPKFVPTMNQFVDFFITTQDAHFNSMVIKLTHIFDNRNDSSSIRNYLNSDQAAFSASELETLRKKVDELALIAKGLIEVRHKFVAHKDKELNEKQVFENADITPDQIRTLIDSSANLIDDLRRHKGWSNGVFQSQRFADSTLGVVQLLEKSRVN